MKYRMHAVAFAAALFGAWHAGKRVFLAADNLPATLQALQPLVSGFAGDVSADYRPLAAAAAEVDGELQVLDERACELCVFTSGSTGQPSAIGKRLDQLAREVDALQAAFGAPVRIPPGQAQCVRDWFDSAPAVGADGVGRSWDGTGQRLAPFRPDGVLQPGEPLLAGGRTGSGSSDCWGCRWGVISGFRWRWCSGRCSRGWRARRR